MHVCEGHEEGANFGELDGVDPNGGGGTPNEDGELGRGGGGCEGGGKAEAEEKTDGGGHVSERESRGFCFRC